MKQEEKELLLKDLCARLPYRVIGLYAWKCKKSYDKELTGNLYDELCSSWNSTEDSQFLPYLRTMSSMTEEEWKELNSIGYIVHLYDGDFGVDMRAYCKNGQPYYRRFSEFSTIEDWLNAHHFDYRDLILKGLALAAPEGMYNLKVR